MTECIICATEYEEGSIEICSNCGFDLTPFPEFIGEYPRFWLEREQTQVNSVRQMWVNFQETKQKLRETLKTQSESHNLEIKKLNSQLVQNNNTVIQLNNQVKKLESDAFNLRKELEVKINHLEQEKSTIKRELNEANNNITNLKSQIKNFGSEIRDLIDPQNADAYYKRGETYRRFKKYEEALADYSKAIELNPKCPDYYSSRGDIYYCCVKKYEEALADYSKAIEVHPKSIYYHKRARIYKRSRQYQEAIWNYTKAIELDPQDTFRQGWYEDRAEIYEHLCQYQEVVCDYTKAIELDPKSWIYIRRGYAHYKLEQYQEAITDVAKGIEIINRRYDIVDLYDSFRLFRPYDDEQYQKALSYFNKVINFAPDYAKSYYYRGLCHYILGNQKKEALSDINKTIELEPQNRCYYEVRASMLSRRDEYQELISDYTTIIDLDSDCYLYYRYRAQTYSRLRKYREMILDFTKLMKLIPQSNYYSVRAYGYYLLGEYHDAIRDLSKNIEIMIQNSRRYRPVFDTRELTQWFGKEIHNLYTKAIQIHHKDCQDYYNRGLAHLFLGIKYQEAILDLTKAISLNSQYGESYHVRGIVYYYLKKDLEAKKDWQQAVKLYQQQEDNTNQKAVINLLISLNCFDVNT